MKLTHWIAAAALALGLTPAVQAQYRGYPANPGYRWDADRTMTLAHQVDETATWIHRQAERNNRRPDRAEARALAALHELNEAASQLHRQVESYRQDPRHTQNDFADLVRAYNNASRALRWIEPRPYIDRGMDRIAGLLTEMSQVYGRPYSYRWSDRYDNRHDRNDRYDRDRDRDDDHGDRDNDGYRPPVHR